MQEKSLVWVGNSKREVLTFPEMARRRAGYELHQVQLGLPPSDWRAVKAVGPGVRELRVHAEGEHRILYVATLPEAVYVLHAFSKKSQRTPAQAIELARKRLSALMADRASREQ